MTVYDEIEIEDLDFNSDNATFYYNCPCGDRFRITLEEMLTGDDIAECPSCSLQIRIIFQKEDLGVFQGMVGIVAH
jgi:diphthamide biosynthesis protein 3